MEIIKKKKEKIINNSFFSNVYNIKKLTPRILIKADDAKFKEKKTVSNLKMT